MFESLESARIICVDIETYDPAIEAKKSAGELRGGFIAGIALATDTGHSCYYPIAHEEGANLDREKVLRYLRTELGRESQPKLGTNLPYDLGYLKRAGVPVKGKLLDIVVAESLLDENRVSYSLSSLAQKYLNSDKDDTLLYQYLAQTFGGKPERKQQAKRIWQAPGDIVEDYALSDVRLPIEIYKKQRLLLQQQGLVDLFNVESDIIPILLAMKHRGVRIDSRGVDQYREKVNESIDHLHSDLVSLAGDINFSSTKQLSEFFTSEGIKGTTTKTGLLQTDKSALASFNHPVATKLLVLKELQTQERTFLKGYLKDHLLNGRLHAQFDSVRNGHGGTVTGRFSSSKPNLQNIPKASAIRSFFLPEEGEQWYSSDWSQIEYRLLVHFAMGEGASEARNAYLKDSGTDYHAYTHNLIAASTGLDLPRKKVKGINFGLIYGMGKDKLASMLELPVSRAIEVRDKYHDALPYVRRTMHVSSQQARMEGYVKTILGRRRRFDLWVPAEFTPHAKALPYQQALEQYGTIARADTHKALNARLQGSCADIMKKAMVNIWNSGVCDVLGAPISTIHDELNFSVPRTKEAVEAHAEVVNIMNNSVKLKVPLLTTTEIGDSWGVCQ